MNPEVHLSPIIPAAELDPGSTSAAAERSGEISDVGLLSEAFLPSSPGAHLCPLSAVHSAAALGSDDDTFWRLSYQTSGPPPLQSGRGERHILCDPALALSVWIYGSWTS